MDPKLFLLILSCLPVHARCFVQTPTLVTNSTCMSNGFYDCSQCPCDLDNTTEYSDLSIEIVTGISGFLCSLFVVLYILRRKLRKRPNSLTWCLSIAGVLFSTNTFLQVSKPAFWNIDESPQACNISGYALEITNSLIHFYILSCLLYSLDQLEKPIGEKLAPTFTYHLIPLMLGALVAYFYYHMNAFGMNISGFCEIRSSNNILFPIVRYCTILIMSLGLVYLLRRASRWYLDTVTYKQRLLKLYFGYSVWIAFFFLLESANEIATTVAVYLYDEDLFSQSPGLLTALHILYLVGTSFKSLSPVVLIYASLKHTRESKGNKDKIGNRDSLVSLTITDFDLDKSPRVVLEERRTQTLYSLLAGLYVTVVHGEARNIKPEKTQEYEFTKFVVSNEAVKQKAAHIYNEVALRRGRFRLAEIKAYETEKFRKLIDYKHTARDLLESFAFSQNHSRILEYVHRAEFEESSKEIFTTYDGRFQLRIINQDEKDAFLNALSDYSKYILAHENSLLVRVLGLFRMTVFESKESFYVLLYRCMCDNTEKINRHYELKGIARPQSQSQSPTHSPKRQPLAEGDDILNTKNPVIEGVLKDHHFDKLERTLKLDPDHRDYLYSILERDIEFLVSKNLRGYALTVYIVDQKFRIREIGLSMISEADEDLFKTPSLGFGGLKKAELELTTTSLGSYNAHNNTEPRSPHLLGSPYSPSHTLTVPEIKSSPLLSSPTGPLHTITLMIPESRGTSIPSPKKVVEVDPFKAEALTDGIYYKIGITEFFHTENMRQALGAFIMSTTESKSPNRITQITTRDYGERLLIYVRKIFGNSKH